jgi:hypothetical protein
MIGLFFILLIQEVLVLIRHNRLWLIHEYQCVASYKLRILDKSATDYCLQNTAQSIITLNRLYFGEKYRNLEKTLSGTKAFTIQKSEGITDWINQKELPKFFRSEQANLSHYYYLAAIGDNVVPAEAIHMYAGSILLNPELSFMYLELSDELVRSNRFDMARSILSSCQQFDHPSSECGFKLRQISDPDYQPDKRGSLNQVIENYYWSQM